jgi:beta-barrel assembly-enhancing protease
MYNAILIDNRLDKSQVHGFLTIENNAIIFTSGEITKKLVIDELKITTSVDKKTIYLSHPDHKFYIQTGSQDILNQPQLQSISSSAYNSQSLRKDTKKINALVWIFGLIFFGGIAALLAFREPIINRLAAGIPDSVEQKIGQQYIDDLIQKKEIDTTFSINETFKSKAALLLKHVPDSDRFKLYISNSKEINAYALPGSHIVFNKGLLAKAKNWEEVLGVLGHEAAHVTESHHSRGVLSKVGVTTLLSLLLGDAAGLSGIIVEASSQLEQLTYSRGFEKEADDKGLEYLMKAKINPIGLKTFFETLEKEEKNTTKIPELLSTHPSPDNRIKSLESKIKALKETDFIELGNYTDFQNSILK